jgi:hypothetical protein
LASRLTDTFKWQKNWYFNLLPKYKLVWIYLLDSCDNAGFVELNIKKLNFEIGDKYNIDDLEKNLEKHLKKIKNLTYWIPKFIQFQYPKGLSAANKAHKSVIDKLIRYDIMWKFENLKFSWDFNTLQAPSEPLGSPCQGVLDKDKDICIKNCIILNAKFSNFDEELIEFINNIIKPTEDIQTKWIKENTIDEIKDELYRFKNFLEAKGKKYKNYSSAFSNWLKSPYRVRKPEIKKTRSITDGLI